MKGTVSTRQHTHTSTHIGSESRISWQEGGDGDALLNIDALGQYTMISIDTLKEAKSLQEAITGIVGFFEKQPKIK